ncbi:MAG: VOC family protein [Deltaproteobacteria bacterium]|nr:VOC family protein [Deltaproteobacteria bacterium]
MIHPERIAHIVLKVRNLEQSRQFYTEILGMQVMKQVPEIRAVFLSFNGRDHHEIALFEIGDKADAPKMSSTGMLHFAMRLRTEDDLLAAYSEFKAKGVPISFTVNHGVSKSIYFRDPDDNELEVYTDNDIAELDAIKPNAYLGMEKLDFAKDDRGLADVIASMRH